MSAAVHTQTADVEVEGKGLMTYDRVVIKMDAAMGHQIHQDYLAPEIISE